jgi:hypothetical protein
MLLYSTFYSKISSPNDRIIDGDRMRGAEAKNDKREEVSPLPLGWGGEKKVRAMALP